MDPHISVITAMLRSVGYSNDAYDAVVVPEADFVPFDFSYMRDFSGRNEVLKSPFGGHGQNVSNALPA
jgi:hypothetical protein